MLNILIMFYVCLGVVGLVSNFFVFRYRAEYICAFIFVMVVLYVFACFQQLALGVDFVVLVGGVFGGGVILSNIFSVTRRALIIRQFLELAVLFSLSFVISWGADYWAWDEFSHWGAQVEFLISENNLPTNTDVLLFPDYIPGLSLLRYYSATLLAGSGVSYSYFITWLFGLSCLYCISYSESILRSCITVLVVFFAYLLFFQSLVLTLYVDPIQALLFLCALKFSRCDDDESYRVMLLLGLSIILIKHVGIILAGFVGVYYVFSKVYIQRVTIRHVLWRGIIFFALMLFVYFSWFFYVNFYNLQIKVVDTSKLFEGFGVFKNMLSGFSSVLDNRFPHSAYIPPVYSIPGLADIGRLWMFVCLVVILSVFLGFNSSVNRREGLFAFCFFIFSGLLYILFLSYVITVTPWGGDVYSFSRYFSVVLFATFLLQYLVVMPKLSIFRCLVFSVIIGLLGLAVAPPLSSVFVFDKRSSALVNKEYKLKADFLKGHANSDSVIWYINDEKLSLGYYILRMKSLPLKFLHYSAGYYLYQDGNLSKAAERNSRIKLFKKTLCKADYVYVDEMPDEFWREYSSLLGASGRIYKVINKDSGFCGASIVE